MYTLHGILERHGRDPCEAGSKSRQDVAVRKRAVYGSEGKENRQKDRLYAEKDCQCRHFARGQSRAQQARHRDCTNKLRQR